MFLSTKLFSTILSLVEPKIMNFARSTFTAPMVRVVGELGFILFVVHRY